ncbi:ankyrin repeat domain-containing protein [Legionella sp. CNM-4043-24]|uniref:ankyrin repeat domain-containing protein n=1 Tax=Legionella sp. CNM-4043-24 TaxID=3421646 RepID=UPI00403B13E7
MKISDILNRVVALRKASLSSAPVESLPEKTRKKMLANINARREKASDELDELYQMVARENGPVALHYTKQMTADIAARLDDSASAASRSQPAPLPHPRAAEWPDYYNDDLYQKLLPLCQLAYLEEQNGIAEDHALNLSLIFADEKAVYDYLTQFPKWNKVRQLVHDACLFELPSPADCDFSLWKNMAARSQHMLNPRFRELLPHAGELARLAGGRNWDNMTLRHLREVYRQYMLNSSPAHRILIHQGLSAKTIALFNSLQRNNDDVAIPAVFIKGADIGYLGAYLTKLDTQSKEGAALAACLGKLTNCCQYLGGAGEACVRHGIESPNGSFYVLFQGDADNPSLKDPILAQAWVWRSAEGDLCLDSVETPHNTDSAMVADMYRALGLSLCGYEGIKRVNIGAHSGISQRVGFENYPVAGLTACDYQGYTDAMKQLLLADRSMPYLFYGHTGSAELTKIIEDRTAQYFSGLLTLPGDLKDNVELKQAIAFLVSSKQDKDDNPLFQLLLNRAAERSEECRRLVEANRSCARALGKDNANLEDLPGLIEQGAFVGMADKKGNAVLHRVAGNPALLKAILERIPENQRLEALKVVDRNGITALQRVAGYPDSLNTVLALMSQNQRLEAGRMADAIGDTALHWTAENPKSLKIILELIPQDQQLEAVRLANIHGRTVLHIAVRNPESLQVILNVYPVDQRLEAVRITDRYGATVLHNAARFPESLNIILELYPEDQRLEAVKMADIYGNTVMHESAREPESLKTILRLLPPDQQVEAVRLRDRFGKTVLHEATNNPESLKIALEIYPEDQRLDAIKAMDGAGKTVLHQAAGNPESLQTILSLLPENHRLAAANLADEQGKTILHLAADNPRLLKTILALYREDQRLEAVTVKDREGKTALLLAAGNPGSLKAILKRIPKGQGLEAVKVAAANGQTVLQRAAGNPESLKAILKLYPEDQRLEAVRTVDSMGLTPLHAAIRNPECMKIILELYPPDQRLEALKIADQNGFTVLYWAANNLACQKVMLSLLPEDQQLEAVKVSDRNGQTALHWAARNPGSLKVILALYPEDQRLAAVTATDNNGVTPLHIAAQHPGALTAILEMIPPGQRLEAVSLANKAGKTALHLAAGNYKSMEVIHRLIPETQDPEKMTSVSSNPSSFFSGKSRAASSVPDQENVSSPQNP